MNKSAVIFFMLFLFSTGISIGIVISMYENADNMPKLAEQRDSIQDIVIQEIQKNQDEKYEVKEVANTEPEKISPYAKITIEKYYKQCKHSTVEIYDVPKELVNLTKEELQNRYENWEVKKFTTRDVHIFREINANCSSHFVLKEKDGYLAIYKAISEKMTELDEITNIEFASLKEEDKLAIEAGINVYGKEELSVLIEDFES